VYRGPNKSAWRDGDGLVQIPPVDGMSHLPEGVFPETLNDLKTIDGPFSLLLRHSNYYNRFIASPKILVQVPAWVWMDQTT